MRQKAEAEAGGRIPHLEWPRRSIPQPHYGNATVCSGLSLVDGLISAIGFTEAEVPENKRPLLGSLGRCLTMRPEAAGQQQTAPSGLPPEPENKDVEELDVSPDDSKSVTELQNELEFLQWYNGVEDDLLEASYDEYQ